MTTQRKKTIVSPFMFKCLTEALSSVPSSFQVKQTILTEADSSTNPDRVKGVGLSRSDLHKTIANDSAQNYKSGQVSTMVMGSRGFRPTDRLSLLFTNAQYANVGNYQSNINTLRLRLLKRIEVQANEGSTTKEDSVAVADLDKDMRIVENAVMNALSDKLMDEVEDLINEAINATTEYDISRSVTNPLVIHVSHNTDKHQDCLLIRLIPSVTEVVDKNIRGSADKIDGAYAILAGHLTSSVSFRLGIYRGDISKITIDNAASLTEGFTVHNCIDLSKHTLAVAISDLSKPNTSASSSVSVSVSDFISTVDQENTILFPNDSIPQVLKSLFEGEKTDTETQVAVSNVLDAIQNTIEGPETMASDVKEAAYDHVVSSFPIVKSSDIKSISGTDRKLIVQALSPIFISIASFNRHVVRGLYDIHVVDKHSLNSMTSIEGQEGGDVAVKYSPAIRDSILYQQALLRNRSNLMVERIYKTGNSGIVIGVKFPCFARLSGEDEGTREGANMLQGSSTTNWLRCVLVLSDQHLKPATGIDPRCTVSTGRVSAALFFSINKTGKVRKQLFTQANLGHLIVSNISTRLEKPVPGEGNLLHKDPFFAFKTNTETGGDIDENRKTVAKELLNVTNYQQLTQGAGTDGKASEAQRKDAVEKLTSSLNKHIINKPSDLDDIKKHFKVGTDGIRTTAMNDDQPILDISPAIVKYTFLESVKSSMANLLGDGFGFKTVSKIGILVDGTSDAGKKLEEQVYEFQKNKLTELLGVTSIVDGSSTTDSTKVPDSSIFTTTAKGITGKVLKDVSKFRITSGITFPEKPELPDTLADQDIVGLSESDLKKALTDGGAKSNSILKTIMFVRNVKTMERLRSMASEVIGLGKFSIKLQHENTVGTSEKGKYEVVVLANAESGAFVSVPVQALKALHDELKKFVSGDDTKLVDRCLLTNLGAFIDTIDLFNDNIKLYRRLPHEVENVCNRLTSYASNMVKTLALTDKETTIKAVESAVGDKTYKVSIMSILKTSDSSMNDTERHLDASSVVCMYPSSAATPEPYVTTIGSELYAHPTKSKSASISHDPTLLDLMLRQDIPPYMRRPETPDTISVSKSDTPDASQTPLTGLKDGIKTLITEVSSTKSSLFEKVGANIDHILTKHKDSALMKAITAVKTDAHVVKPESMVKKQGSSKVNILLDKTILPVMVNIATATTKHVKTTNTTTNNDSVAIARVVSPDKGVFTIPTKNITEQDNTVIDKVVSDIALRVKELQTEDNEVVLTVSVPVMMHSNRKVDKVDFAHNIGSKILFVSRVNLTTGEVEHEGIKRIPNGKDIGVEKTGDIAANKKRRIKQIADTTAYGTVSTGYKTDGVTESKNEINTKLSFSVPRPASVENMTNMMLAGLFSTSVAKTPSLLKQIMAGNKLSPEDEKIVQLAGELDGVDYLNIKRSADDSVSDSAYEDLVKVDPKVRSQIETSSYPELSSDVSEESRETSNEEDKLLIDEENRKEDPDIES